jgi:hypothetical protein
MNSLPPLTLELTMAQELSLEVITREISSSTNLTELKKYLVQSIKQEMLTKNNVTQLVKHIANS